MQFLEMSLKVREICFVTPEWEILLYLHEHS